MDSNNSPKSICITIVGDSTVADYPPEDERRLYGWGQVLPKYLKHNVTVINFAKSGESSKSFIANGLWETALRCKADYFLIQFGHNDCPGKAERSTDPNSDYQEYLAKYINDVREFGGTPVLVTPMERCNFDKHGKIEQTLDKYAAAMRLVAKHYGVALIDLNKRSIELYERLGEADSSHLMTYDDRTHFVEAGAKAMALLVVQEISNQISELRPYILDSK